MDWESFKSRAEAVNALVVAVAVATGGAWAWYTFNGELKRENAAAQLEKLRREVNDLKRTAVEVEVLAKPLTRMGSEYHVLIEVIVHNKGNAEVEIPILKKSLRITPIVTPDLPLQPSLATNAQFVPQPLMTNVDGQKVGVSSLTLPAGSQNGLLYLAQVDAAGRYLVEFSTSKRSAEGKTVPDVELSASEVIDVPAKSVAADSGSSAMADGPKASRGKRSK